MIFFGATGAITFGQGDFVLVLYQLGLVGWGLVLLFGNLWKSNADTAYAFGVAGAELFRRPSKTPFVVGGSVLGTALALAGVHEHLVDYLVLLGIFIPPLGGVTIGDYSPAGGPACRRAQPCRSSTWSTSASTPWPACSPGSPTTRGRHPAGHRGGRRGGLTLAVGRRQAQVR